MNFIQKIKNRRINPRGQVSLGVLLYVVFAMLNLITSSWIPVVSHEIFADFSYEQIDDENWNNYYLGEGIYIKQIGTPEEGDNRMLFWEGGENQIRYFQVPSNRTWDGEQDILYSYYDLDNSTSKIIQMAGNTKFFDTYGKSCVGVYNLEPTARKDPEILWKHDENNYDGWEIKMTKVVPDVNGDGFEDIFVSKAQVVEALPYADEEGFNYTQFFLENPSEFNYYYDIEYIDYEIWNDKTIVNQVIISPNYKEYSHVLVDGKTGAVLRDNKNQPIKFANSNVSVIDAVLLNSDLNVSRRNSWELNDTIPEMALHESTMDRSIYMHSQFYFKYNSYSWSEDINRTKWKDAINTYYLRNGTLKYSINESNGNVFNTTYSKNIDYVDPLPNNDENDDDYPNKLPLNRKFYDYDINFNAQIKDSVTISLAEHGFRKIKSVGKGFAVEFYPNEYFENSPIIQSHVFNASSGEELWHKKKGLVVGHKDFDGDGLFNIGQYIRKLDDNSNYTDHSEYRNVSYYESAKFYLYDELDGDSLAVYDFNIHKNETPFNTRIYSTQRDMNIDAIFPAPVSFSFSSDDMNGDEIPEIYGWVANISYKFYEEDQWEDYIAAFRNFRLTLSPNTGIMNLSSIFQYPESEFGWNQFRVEKPLPSFSSFFYSGRLTPLHLDIDGDNQDDYYSNYNHYQMEKNPFITVSSLRNIPPNFFLNRLGNKAEDLKYRESSDEERVSLEEFDNSEIEGFFWRSEQDWREIDNVFIVQRGHSGKQRVPVVYIYENTFYYYNNILTSIEEETFTNFFTDFSQSLTYGAIGLIIVCALILAISIKPKGNNLDNIIPNDNKIKLNKKQKGSNSHNNEELSSKENLKTGEKDGNSNENNGKKRNFRSKPDLDTIEDERLKEKVKTRLKNLKILRFITIISVILILVAIGGIFMYLRTVARFYVQYSETYVGPQSSILALIIIYPLILPLLFILPMIYKKVAPFFAEKTFFNLQRGYFKRRMAQGKLDYKIIVTQMDVRYDVSIFTYIKRAILPIFIAFTIGISIYTGLSSSGWLTGLISNFKPNFVGLTNPKSLGIVRQDVPFDRIWVEMGNFAGYCILPMLVTYFLTAVLIPSGWVLDDAGITYYVKYKKYRGINDVESVSTWLLGVISGFFGMSGLLSFISLFNPFLGQLGSLEDAIELNMVGASGNLGVFILILTLILFPLMISLAIMIACIHKVETNFYSISKRLFNRMEDTGIDTTPVEIAAVLDADVGEKPWTDGQKDVITGDELRKRKKKKEALTDEKKEEEHKNILQTLKILPELIKEMSLFEAVNLIKAKVLEANMYELDALEEKLFDLSMRVKNFKSIRKDFQNNGRISVDVMATKLSMEKDELNSIIEEEKGESDFFEYKNGTIEINMEELKSKIEEKFMQEVKQEQIIDTLLAKIFLRIIENEDIMTIEIE